MVKILILVFFFFSNSAFAQNISLNFDNAKLSDVFGYIVKTQLKRDFVISGDVKLDQLVTFKLSNIQSSNLLEVFTKILLSYGVSVSEAGGVLYVSRHDRSNSEMSSFSPPSFAASVSFPSSIPSAPAPVAASLPASTQVDRSSHEVRVYFPRHRSVDYLNAAVRIAGGHLGDAPAVSSFSSVAPYSGSPSPLNTGYPQGQFNPLPQSQPLSQNQDSKFLKDAVVYSGNEKTIEKVDALLEKLDRPVFGVQIKAAVLEVTDGKDSQRSLNILANLLNMKLGITIEAGATAANRLSFKTTSLSALLSAVDGDSRFRYLSEPLLRVIDGETAKLTVGQEVPTRGAISQDKNGNNVQSIEYKQAGLLLEVTPRIFLDNIQLKINQQISSFITTNTSGIDSPTLLKREAGSTVRLNDGEVIVLAGLDEERENNSSSGVFFLPSFLHSSLHTKAKSQILIFMEVKRVGVGQSI